MITGCRNGYMEYRSTMGILHEVYTFCARAGTRIFMLKRLPAKDVFANHSKAVRGVHGLGWPKARPRPL